MITVFNSIFQNQFTVALFVASVLIELLDIFDIHFSATNKWYIDEEVIRFRNGNGVSQEIVQALAHLRNLNSKFKLSGLRELVGDDQKDWDREKMLDETIELLESCLFTYKS